MTEKRPHHKTGSGRDIPSGNEKAKTAISRRATLAAALAGATGAIATARPASAANRKCSQERHLAQPRKLDIIPEKLLTRKTLDEVKLKGWRGVGDLLLRMRVLTIEPGGFVPTHYHDDRPSIVYVLQGELIEHNSFCSEPVTHKAGDWTAEFGPFVGHWWENRGKETAIVLSADVIPPEYRDMDAMDM